MLIDVKYVSFLIELLNRFNSCLSEDDIYVLSKLNSKYSVCSISNEVLTETMPIIISDLIIEALPYRIAKLYVGAGAFVAYKNRSIVSIVPDGRLGWYEIQCIVKDMNDLIKDED